MAKLPKIKVISPLRHTQEIYELEQVKDVLFGSSDIPMHLLVDDQLLTSFEQLVQLSAQDQYKDREFIEVREMPVMPTGG